VVARAAGLTEAILPLHLERTPQGPVRLWRETVRHDWRHKTKGNGNEEIGWNEGNYV